MPDGSFTKSSRKLFAGAVKALADRQVRVIVSTTSEDREGDIIELAGIDLSNYQRNPIILFNHKADYPIARCIDIRKEGSQLIAVAEFPPEGTSSDSDKVYQLIKAGILNAASIGFIPIEWSFIEENSWSRRFTKTEMLEFSFVSIPANADAIIVERALNSGCEDLMNLNEVQKALNHTTALVPVSQALKLAASGAEMAERHLAGLQSKSQEDDSPGADPENKGCKPNKPEDKTDDNDEDDKSKSDEGEDKGEGMDEGESKTDDNDEDDKSKSEEGKNKSIENSGDPNPADTGDQGTSEQAEASADASNETKRLSRQKALRELQLIQLRAGVP